MSEKDNGEARPRRIFGIPVSWDPKNWYKGVWNAEDARLFPPRRMGIGWSLNFRELLRRMGILK
jgi:uncharacterized membrane protein